jgi:hypothetical protein
MRKKSLLAISVVLLLAAGVAATSVSSAAAPNASRPRVWPRPSAAQAAAATAAAEAATKAKHVTRLVLILRLVEFRNFDAPPVGGAEGPGDTTLATFDAFTPGGRRVGHTEARFTTMFRDEIFAEVTILLDGRGQLLLRASPAPPETDPQPNLAVVGGTGEFRNARGQVFRLPPPTPEDDLKLVFALLL